MSRVATHRVSLRLCLLAITLVGFRSSVADAAEQLQYRGQLVQQAAGGDAVPVRAFAVTAWVRGEGPAREMLYRVEDAGRGGLAWWERIGRYHVADGTGTPPQLRHVHLGRPYTLVLPSPVVTAGEPLTADSTWEQELDGRSVSFEVTGEQRIAARDCWEVNGTGDAGQRHEWLVAQDSGVLVRAASRVFIGQGERFELQLELDTAEPPAIEVVDRELEIADKLLALLGELELSAAAVEGLTADQLTRATAALPPLQAAAKETSWARYLEGVAADLTADGRRAESLAALAARCIGKPAPEGQLRGLNGQPMSWHSDQGEVVVLHFWEYRGTPESPFGQVGYLDFLAGKLQGKQVRVYGVAVDEGAADPQQLAGVRREVQKFSTEFIRMGYPLTIDDGSLLASFGDPRPHDTPLPLWVVIGPDGKVVHYRTGLYTVDPVRGLAELHAVLTGLTGQ